MVLSLFVLVAQMRTYAHSEDPDGMSQRATNAFGSTLPVWRA